MSKSWFEQWFNTKYYHILYSNHDESEAKNFIVALMKFLEIPEKSEIIDIGCGRGRHARFLSKLNYNVTGIDIADASIHYANQYEEENLQFYCFDMRKIFKKEEFDLALNLFTSYGFLRKRAELSLAMNSMGNNIKKGGYFVLDYLNAEKIRNTAFHHEVINENGIQFKIEKKIVGHQVVKKIEVTDGDNKLNFTEHVHLITLDEFKELFENASLKILHTFGDYKLNPFESNNSNRLILIAEKIQ